MDTKVIDDQDILYIIMPAYNEEENIQAVVETWYPIVEKYNGGGCSRLVLINDGSTDNTAYFMEKLKDSRPLFCPLTKFNSGHGATVLYGYQYALKNNAQWIFQTDSDGQTEAKEFDEFWNLRKSYDAIIGYRSHRKDGFLRVFVTKILRLVIYFCFKVWVTDGNTPFRLMEAESLRDNIQYIPAQFHLSNVLLSVIYIRRGQRVKFLPIIFKNREKGCNSVNFRKIMKIGVMSISDFRKIHRSLKIFGI